MRRTVLLVPRYRCQVSEHPRQLEGIHEVYKAIERVTASAASQGSEVRGLDGTARMWGGPKGWAVSQVVHEDGGNAMLVGGASPRPLSLSS